MDPSRVNSNGERDGSERKEENPPPTPPPTPAASISREALQLHYSQLQRALEAERFRSSSGFDYQTLESSFGSLSVNDSSLRPQNPLLDQNRWTNRPSPSASSSGINGGGDFGGGARDWYRCVPSHHHSPYTQPMMMNQYLSSSQNDYLNGGSFTLAGPSNGGFMNGGDVSYPSRARRWDSSNGFDGSGLFNNGSWRSSGGFLNNYHSVASRAKDQDESVKLQDKIDVGSKEEIDAVFNGVISEFCDLMVDPFAYPVVERLMMKCSSEQITRIIDMITRYHIRFVSICMDPLGTRSIQSLLRCLHSEEQVLRLVGAISMGALTFTRSNNAKHVILLCFDLFHPSQNRDLLEVIAQNCDKIAVDQHGCCMLQQCLGSVCQVVKQRLIHEIINHALKLCVDSYGNYVVQYVVELKDRNVTLALLHQLLGNYAYLSRNKYGSHAVQKFLLIQYIDPTLIVCDLLRDIDTLLLDPYGNYVIQTAWSVCKGDPELRILLKRHIERNKPLMRCNMFGNKILEKLGL